MKISTKGRYALRMLLDLAENSGGDYVSLKDIAERQDISKKYLEQIVPMLSKAGILKTTRGNKGGYMLVKSAAEYTVGDVLRATEGSLSPVSCLDYSPNECQRAAQCRTLFVWEGLYETTVKYLDSITLQDILDRNPLCSGGDYCI